ncbi:agouti-signaling protein isoform X1 [Corvus moneduloides]|uniref:Agouti-signaling protein n=1 Tax=Corvus moneduloides TaxID=1196302 RepID=A0A8U7N4B2_CORMO|nr:agouti-signaling protein isoform X1 [Corvus moneduloides]XP_031983364.1 agouti-signaling protein isoform X1 [Corvus moneduloides]XP_031983365.1 agouti-signaling protein isoform X1 [Corvus moneduloides]
MTMEFFLPTMERKNLFLSLLLCCSLFRAADSHLVIEEKTECDLSSKMDLSDLPPISIVDVTRRSQKVSRKEAEYRKSSQKKAEHKASLKPRPPPAANCVPTFKTCKPHLNSCCHYCALCKCRIFQTICSHVHRNQLLSPSSPAAKDTACIEPKSRKRYLRL